MAKRKKARIIHKTIPEQFLERLTDMVGHSVSQEISRSFVERPTTFRVNTIKTTREEVLTQLQQQGFKVQFVPWNRNAFILKKKTQRELEKLPLYKEGKIYVQSLASMVPPVVLDPQPGEKVLDLTAAPGSKTSQMAAMMDLSGELLANDVHPLRVQKLQHNMQQLGVVSTEDDQEWKFAVHAGDGAALCREYPAYFDKVLLDVPCSGEARFVEGNKRTFAHWSEQWIADVEFLQRKLILSAWTALKPGGEMVYSTCTFAPEENELQVANLLDRFDDIEVVSISISGLQPLPIMKQWHGTSIDPAIQKALRIMPTKDIEGFFIAKFRKKNIS